MKGSLNTVTQQWGFPFSNRRPHTFTAPELLKAGEMPKRCEQGADLAKEGLQEDKRLLSLHLLKKKNHSAWASFHLPESSAE